MPPSSPSRSLTPTRLAFAGGLLVGISALVVLYHHDPSASTFYPRCVFKLATGLDCPGCGSTRALYHLLHGDFVTALRFNPMLFVMMAVIAPALPSFFRGKTAAYLNKPATAWAIFGVLIAWWIFRNTPLYPFF
jgi:hypothetical protein